MIIQYAQAMNYENSSEYTYIQMISIKKKRGKD